ncbi:MAG: SbcC/MukB-like Walker B domain-containing protein, partial [Armatimonadota bacterium]
YRLEQIHKELTDLNAKREELKSLQPLLKRYEEAKNEYKRLKELQVYEAERQQITGQLKTLEADQARLRDRLNQYESAKRRRAELMAQLSKTEVDLKTVEERIGILREERVVKQHGLRAEIGQLDKQRIEIEAKRVQIAEAGREGKCPTCERPLGEELNSVLEHFGAHIEQITARISDLEKELAKLSSSYESLIIQANTERNELAAEYEKLLDLKAEVEATLKECEKAAKEIELKEAEISRLRKRLSELPEGFDQKRFQELHRIGEELRPYREKEVAILADLDREPSLREEEASLFEQVKELRKNVADLERSIEELGFSREDHESIIREFEDATQTLLSIALELERCRGEHKLASSKLENLENEEMEYKRKAEELKAKRSENAHLRTLVKAFDDLRTELNERIRPELESVASELLSVMMDGRYNLLRITDDYRPIIVDDGEEKPVISGGEDDIVNLSLRLAISQMIADRAGQSFSLLILDEVFGSLDETRRQNVINLLQNLKNRFEQIILITHIESIYDALDNCIWIEFDERTKTSRIVERRVEQTDIISVGA